ncbi:hypothetical protein GCM10009760_27560 [Kitasatospora kazusensis]|uniref:Uncharacterized protein n=1 Tax=Kitasatospora kazusensis TaxID=407974 RepID=A0ABP5L9M1_9ACTN
MILSIAAASGIGMASSPQSSQGGLAYLVAGLPGLAFGLLRATNFRGVVTRQYAQQVAYRARLPKVLRWVSPPAARPGVQRVVGAAIAIGSSALIVAGLLS